MIYKKLFLNEIFPGWNQSNPEANLLLYLQESSQEIESERLFPCVVVCPGGSYEFTSDREAEPVALRYTSMGYSAVVLRYSAGHVKFPIQLLELSMTIAWLRQNKSFQIHNDKIAVCGFSAGGHLAGSLLNLWDNPLIVEKSLFQQGENRPNAGVLCYPVITMGEFSHLHSFANLLGEGTDRCPYTVLSLENSVNEKNPPCFLWHSLDDPAVPAENSLLYAAALRKYNIPMEFHIYPDGEHGLSLGDYSTTNSKEVKSYVASQWFSESVRFLNSLFEIPF